MAAEGPSRVLVTDGAGFIGRRLVRALLERGGKVTVVDRWPPELALHRGAAPQRRGAAAAEAAQ